MLTAIRERGKTTWTFVQSRLPGASHAVQPVSLEVGVVGVGFLARVRVGGGGDEADGRVVEAFLGGVFVGGDGAGWLGR
jgi:hypothetical protein